VKKKTQPYIITNGYSIEEGIFVIERNAVPGLKLVTYLVACLSWRAFPPYFRMYPLLRWELKNYQEVEYSHADFVYDIRNNF